MPTGSAKPRPILYVLLAVVLVEWAHHRLGQPTLFEVLAPDPATEVFSTKDPGFGPVTESEFQHYTRILELMHVNRMLTIEDAAREEGLSLAEFRELERRIQRDPGLVDRVRFRLRENAEEHWRVRQETFDDDEPEG